MPTPPQLTPEQRASALRKAAEVRTQRAEIKQKLKHGEITLSSLLERTSSDDVVGKMKVISILENLPGYGKVRAQKVLNELGVNDTRRLQGLGPNQKSQLLNLVS